jgi:hypothetical protein
LQEIILYLAKLPHFQEKSDSPPANNVILHKGFLLFEVDLCPHPTDTVPPYCIFLQENFSAFLEFMLHAALLSLIFQGKPQKTPHPVTECGV